MVYDFSALSDIFKDVPDGAVSKTADIIKKHPRIFLYGAGRSGLMTKAFAMRLAQAGYTVYAVGETVTPAIAENDLLLLASASGKTESVLRYAVVAKELGAAVYSITASENSPLSDICQSIVTLSAPTKDSKPSGGSIMGTLFEQALLLFFDAVVKELCTDGQKMRTRHANLE